MKCAHCQIKTGSGRWDGDMPFLCDVCYDKFQEYWLKWIKKKFPPHGYMPMWYVNWHENTDRGKLCREWNKNEPRKKEVVQFT